MTVTSVASILQGCGVRPSHQRLAIMSYLLSTRKHPTADEVYNALSPEMPTLSKATVYNTLNILSIQGAVKMLTINPNEKRFDGFTHPHAHLLCETCEQLFDINLAQNEIEAINSIASEHSVNQRELYLIGVCATCMSKAQNSTIK